MKKTTFTIITATLTTLLSTATLFAAPDKGPVIKLLLVPSGIGVYNIPYDYSINGGTGSSLTSGSSYSGDATLDTLSGYSVSCGYFYDCLQADLSFSRFATDNLYPGEAYTADDNKTVDVTAWDFDARAGYRFFDPGDTSYTWIYLGIRHSCIETSFNSTEADATGIIAGIYGFNSYGLSSPFEFVLTYEIYSAVFIQPWNSLDSDVRIDDRRKTAADLGFSLGLGCQYEPNGISVLLKASPFYSFRRYGKTDDGEERRTNVSMGGAYIGIEVIVSIPDYNNNSTD